MRQISDVKLRDYINTLSNKLSENIFTTKDLKSHLLQHNTNIHTVALKNLFNYMEYSQEMEEFNGISLDKWRKAVVIKQSGVREVFITDSELLEAYEHVRDKTMFKLLVYSGSRLTHAIASLKKINEVVVTGNVCRIPISSEAKGKKKAYWVFFPASFLNELKNYKVTKSDMRREVTYKRVSANTLRKWFLNFCISNGVPESIADFYEGRASITVGSTHYLNKVRQGDEWYEKIIEAFPI